MSTKQDEGGHLQREQWSSRIAFIFAAVGSAVGFGNVWRFPALAKTYGGGAFFVPYLLALFIIGIPVIFLEISLGQFWQTGDVGVFASFHRRLRGVGVASVACGYMVVSYYSMLIAWVVHAFFDSWSDAAPWTDENVNGTVATDYFFNEIIGMSTLGDDLTATRVIGANIGYSALTWFIIWACIAFGLKWTGRITYVTMGLPIILLFIFLGKGVSLEGSEDGIKEYIGIWDMSILKDQGDVWSTAVSQIFFSLSVTFGIMTAYGSHLPRNEPAFFNSCTVAICNSLFSFISGFAVFASLGHLAFIEETTVNDLEIGGFALVFGTWPVVLGKLPGGAHWVRLLFFDLFLLGIDSAFSFMEAILTVARDTKYFRDTPKWKVAGTWSLTGFLLSIMYSTDAGLIWLDTIDFYVNFVMILVGFFETFALGWVYGIEKQVEKFGAPAVVSYAFANFGSVILACGLWFGLDTDQALWAGFVGLAGFYIIGLAVTFSYLGSDTSKFADLAFGNVLEYKKRVEPVIGHVPLLFCFLVKQIVPHLLLILFINLAQSRNSDGESKLGHYGGYNTRPFQVLGVLTVAFALFLFLVGVFVPDFYEPLALPESFRQPEDIHKEEEEAADNIMKEEDDTPTKTVDDIASPPAAEKTGTTMDSNTKDVEAHDDEPEEVASEEEEEDVVVAGDEA